VLPLLPTLSSLVLETLIKLIEATMSLLILDSPVGTDDPISPSPSFEGIEDEDNFFFAAIFQNSDAISPSLFFILQSIKNNDIAYKIDQDSRLK
jgi:hypothetical protein